jgi:tripartite-type tricarboxylate transporter receptor subunit TctC
MPFIQDGKLKPMVVTGTKRLAELPDVPTLDEIGLTGYPSEGGWIGIVAPPGTPAAVVDKLNAAINEGLKLPETQASLLKLGFYARPGSPREFAARIADDSEKWAAVVKLIGAKMD